MYVTRFISYVIAPRPQNKNLGGEEASERDGILKLFRNLGIDFEE
jgi:hypothetical protein